MESKEFTAALWSLSPNVIEDPNETLGMLTFKRDELLILEIPAGVLLDWPKIPIEGGYMQSHTADGLHADQVYGFSQNGDYYLLREVSSPGPGISCPGMEKQTLRGTSLFVSREPLEANPVVKSITVKFPGLREWLGVIPFDVSMKFECNRVSSIDFKCDLTKANSIILFENDEIEISINLINIHKGGPTPSYSFEFETDCEMEISFKKEESNFDDCMERWVHNAISFLAFCTGFKYSIDNLIIETSKGVKAEYYALFVGAPGAPVFSQLQSMPFPYQKIKEKISIMISNWYGFDSYLRNRSTLLTSLMNKWNMPLDMLFLASAQAFEAASRSGVDECEISEDDLRERLEAIKNSDLKSTFKKWACYKLKYARWRSANSLAKELIRKLDGFAAYVVPDSNRFLKDHRTHRDAYTHRRSLSESESLSNEELYYHMEAVQLLTYGAIALNVGLEPNEIVAYFEESRYRWYCFYRSRKQYAAAE